MSIFTEHPAARWGLPAAAVGVIGVTALALNQSASADAGLPSRTAQQLLADVRSADVSSLSGTVVQTSNLGLPQLPGLTTGGPASGGSGGAGGLGGAGGSSLTSLLSGTHTWRVWVDGPSRQRLALVGTSGESDVIRNGSDLWLWSSADKTAVHHTLGTRQRQGQPGAAPHRPSGTLPGGVPSTPDQAASAALAAMGRDTAVTTSGAASVAGRSAYELVLTPKDKATRVASVRIAIDAEKHVPLRVQVYSTKLSNPAFEVGFTSVDFSTPEARQFAFTPPAGTTVTQPDQSDQAGPKGAAGTNPAPSKQQAAAAAKAAGATRAVGSGWSTVVVTRMPTGATSGSSTGSDATTRQLATVLGALPTASGSWGSGHVLEGTLFSAVVTDDGRVAFGAVAPQTLYTALAAR
ncbi:outer membrane lipoprotein carrier protein LolA [Terrabacter sp. BE26]|uniref:LolA family protein n=1 Tax=Terrabacter sp. BE26 TaxID=2898152 RepID=UPI0035BE5015